MCLYVVCVCYSTIDFKGFSKEFVALGRQVFENMKETQSIALFLNAVEHAAVVQPSYITNNPAHNQSSATVPVSATTVATAQTTSSQWLADPLDSQTGHSKIRMPPPLLNKDSIAAHVPTEAEDGGVRLDTHVDVSDLTAALAYFPNGSDQYQDQPQDKRQDEGRGEGQEYAERVISSSSSQRGKLRSSNSRNKVRFSIDFDASLQPIAPTDDGNDAMQGSPRPSLTNENIIMSDIATSNQSQRDVVIESSPVEVVENLESSTT